VTRIGPFGIFVEVAPGIEGMIHVSELSSAAIDHPAEAVAVGEEILAIVLMIDPWDRKIGLSRKKAT